MAEAQLAIYNINMIEYIIAQNPDDRILTKACDIINAGGILCFPTDTNWIIAASPFHRDGVDKIYNLKQENKNKHFSLLCPDFSTASEVANIGNSSFRIIKKIIPGHYTFIFEANKKISKALKASKTDKEIGIRFIPNDFVTKLLEQLGDVVISTNLTHAMLNISEDEDIYSYQIDESLGGKIDMIIDPGELEFVGPSTIIDFSAGEDPILVRKGSGDISIF